MNITDDQKEFINSKRREAEEKIREIIDELEEATNLEVNGISMILGENPVGAGSHYIKDGFEITFLI